MRRWRSLWILNFGLVLSGCFGSSGNTIGDGADLTKPNVEATIEFQGPKEKWAGPQDFAVRVTTLKPGNAQITLTPPLIPRSKHSDDQDTDGLTVDAARAEFSKLESAMQGQESSFNGCLLPIRVRLVRVDGTRIEKIGCRGQSGWPRIASEMANRFLEKAVTSQDE